MTLPTVLIADDDRSIRTVLTQALGRSGYQVRSHRPTPPRCGAGWRMARAIW
jgi:DNA-binding NtrC family response regulator